MADDNVTMGLETAAANLSVGQQEANSAMNDQTRATLHFQYLAWGVTGTTIAALGLFGNLLSVVVLSHRRMLSPTSSYLTALAVYDSLVLISLVLFFSLPSIYLETGHLGAYYTLFPYIQPFAYPLALISQTCSIYTTVGFTVERYIAVCWPLQAAKMCTISRTRKSILIILICSVIYNIPRMLEYETIEYKDLWNNTVAKYEPTPIGRDPTFRIVYFIVMHISVMLVIPCSLLMVLNVLLIRAVRRSALQHTRNNTKQRHENNLTVMLVSVVVVFLTCQVPSIVDNICNAIIPEETLYSPPFVKLTCISSLMVITNSASNFYLYCVFGRKFRQIFCLIFCKCWPQFTASQKWNEVNTQTQNSILCKAGTISSPRPGYQVNKKVMQLENGNHHSTNNSTTGPVQLDSELRRYGYSRLATPGTTHEMTHTRETVM